MKTVEEWLQAFNLLYNNIASDKAPGLEPFEISRFLTDAQNAVVIALYKGTYGSSFESNEETTAALECLVKQSTSTVPLASAGNLPTLSEYSVMFAMPSDVLFRTLELCRIQTDCKPEGETVPVVPVTQDEYWRTQSNPFKKSNKRRVLRLASPEVENSTESHRYVELISENDILSYTVRYIRFPKPIVLEKLEDGLSIDGATEEQTCELPEQLHQIILAEAVRMAKATWNG